MTFSEITQFSSPAFFLFIATAVVIFYSAPVQYRKHVLLLVSYGFYSSYHFLHIGILLCTTVLDFFFAQKIYERLKAKKSTAGFLAFCLGVNLGMLGYFKYRHLFFGTVFDFSYQTILLPLGLSFFTLQSVGYVLDVARGKTLPERDFFSYALFVSFFPQIIAGPIERSDKIIPQYKKHFRFNAIPWRIATYLFAFGFFKKYLVADNLALILKSIPITGSSSLILKHLSLIYFWIRLYCDFSGYTDMARAIAILFNIHLSENFNFPLFAKSPQDHWDRWHMSLGSWIRSYFYNPLLVHLKNPYLALLIVFPIMGLWHGANYGFLLWGFAWAIVIIAFKKLNFRKLHPVLATVIMFNLSAILVVFYKVESIKELGNYFTFGSSQVEEGQYLNLLLASLPMPMFVLSYEFFLFLKKDYYQLLKSSPYVLVGFYIILLMFYLFYSGVTPQQIFYMQF